jgi:hypothetical protein
MVIVDWPVGVLEVAEPHPEIARIDNRDKKTSPTVRSQVLRRFWLGRAGQNRTARTAPNSASPSFFAGASAVCTLVSIVSVDITVPEVGVTLAGLKLQVVYTGKPEQAKNVGALKAFTGMILTIEVVDWPLGMVTLPGESKIVKSGGGVTTTVTVFDVEAALLVSPS